VSRGFTQVHIISFIVLIWSLANVFIPLEMALNRAWGVRESRGFWRSQWFAMFMVGISALLAMAFVGGAAFTKYRLLDAVIGPEWQLTHAFLEFAIIKTWMVPFTFLMFFVVFYLVPNTKVNWREVLPASAFTAVLWEISNYVFVWLLPLLGLRDIYGTFIIGVTLMTWGYVSGLLLVLGANLTAKRVFAARQAASGYANDAHPDQSSADV
jgi:membrane protein/epoxyqueuosine reductase